ncbi:hypothetical protein LshimejAT787_1801170 [Lyophyllum shimeji]|uniref:Uncharacterized protein n=1 Tax=Lyophyllum shimeji TaxID=47721 RepID=A0A9P3PZC5_LYOSH|nr:hypothetical protein LshimejAT787_1801170 [Lyophyllum shimeji]
MIVAGMPLTKQQSNGLNCWTTRYTIYVELERRHGLAAGARRDARNLDIVIIHETVHVRRVQMLSRTSVVSEPDVRGLLLVTRLQEGGDS